MLLVIPWPIYYIALLHSFTSAFPILSLLCTPHGYNPLYIDLHNLQDWLPLCVKLMFHTHSVHQYTIMWFPAMLCLSLHSHQVSHSSICLSSVFSLASHHLFPTAASGCLNPLTAAARFRSHLYHTAVLLHAACWPPCYIILQWSPPLSVLQLFVWHFLLGTLNIIDHPSSIVSIIITHCTHDLRIYGYKWR